MAILVNGQLPGPPVYANVGDTVEFTVLNQMPFETTIHFHGITQVGTPWSDGVLGLSQWPIPPNGTFVYTWLADEYGTYFYHSHSRGQLMDGLYGPIVIKPRPGTPAPFSLISEATHDISAMEAAMENPILVTVSDWSHFTSSQMFALQESSGFDIYCQDSVLMNGKGSRYCQTPQEIQKSLTPHNKGVLKGLNTYVAATGYDQRSEALFRSC